MLHYQDQHWALVPGMSCFEAYIPSTACTPKNVGWSFNLDYVTTGPAWRRVIKRQRPSLSIEVTSFKVDRWTDLARTNFWNAEADPDDLLSLFRPPAGELCFTSTNPPEAASVSLRGWVNWRVVERQGGRFLIELAANPEGGDPPEPIAEETFILADGTEETTYRNDDALKEHASIYLVEWVPFGAVTVFIPSNADPLTHAHARVRQLIGITQEPEYISVSDYRGNPAVNENSPVNYELIVKLYYHGYYNGA